MRFHLTTIRADVPFDYWINRARRDEVQKLLLRWQVAALCVSTDAGEDYKLFDAAEAKLSSWIAGDLITCQISSDGKQVIDSRAVLEMRGYFETAGLWSEGVQRWCGVWQGAAVLDQHAGVETSLLRRLSVLLGVQPAVPAIPEAAPREGQLTRGEVQKKLGHAFTSERYPVKWETVWEKIVPYLRGNGVIQAHGKYQIRDVMQAIEHFGYYTSLAESGSRSGSTVHIVK